MKLILAGEGFAWDCHLSRLCFGTIQGNLKR
jgi:hypothetical protein